MKRQNNFWQQNAFLNCSWRFLKSCKLEQLEFVLEKNYWDLETGMQEKLENTLSSKNVPKIECQISNCTVNQKNVPKIDFVFIIKIE